MSTLSGDSRDLESPGNKRFTKCDSRLSAENSRNLILLFLKTFDFSENFFENFRKFSEYILFKFSHNIVSDVFPIFT